MTQTRAPRMTTGNFTLSVAGRTGLCTVACSNAVMTARGVLPTTRLLAGTMVELNVPVHVAIDAAVGTLLLASVATRHRLLTNNVALMLSGSDIHMAFNVHCVTAAGYELLSQHPTMSRLILKLPARHVG
jgi:hypothetical protein